MNIQIIIGSTREGRVSDRVAKWIQNVSEANKSDATYEVVDLRDYELPFFNESMSPQYNPDRKPAPEVKKWLDKVAEADAYIFVTPEYNRAPSAVLKNSIDFLDFQLAKKPVALVGHGSTGGAQAVDSLRSIVPAVMAITIPEALYITERAGQLFDEDGKAIEDQSAKEGMLSGLMTSLETYAKALAPLRG